MAVSLEPFRTLVNNPEAGGISDEAVVSIDNVGRVSAAEPGRIGGHKVKVSSGKGNALATRQTLLTALNQKFGNNIPQNVLKAMNVSKAFSGFSVGKDGVKATNHPLTMRRLRAIFIEVDKADEAGGRELQSALEDTVLNKAEHHLIMSKLSESFPGLNKDEMRRCVLILDNSCRNHLDDDTLAGICKNVISNSFVQDSVKGKEHTAEELEKFKTFAKELNKAYGEMEKGTSKAVPEEKNFGFEVVDESETVKGFYEFAGSSGINFGNIKAAVTNELELRKNLNLFEQKTGIKMTPAERRMCVANVSASPHLVSRGVNKFDLSVSDNCDELNARIAELRSGECYGASEKALRTLSIMMFASPEIKVNDARKVLQLAKQCREAGVGNADGAGEKPPLQRLREIASAIGAATAVEFGTWLARTDGKEKGWTAEQIAATDYRKAELQHNDDSQMMANMLMRVLIAESDGLGDLLQSLTMDDIYLLAIDRKEVEYMLADPSADQIRLRELLGNSSEEAVERDKTLTPAERKEVDRLTKAEVGRFISMALLKVFEREATVHVDATEVDQRIKTYYDKKYPD